MRTRALVGVLLFMLLAGGVAAWADDPQTKPNSPAYDIFQQPAPSPRTFSAPAATVRQFTMPKKFTVTKLKREQVRRLLMNSQTGCYTMRTYIVAREGTSDSTRPVGYQECLPGSQVKMKNTPAEQHSDSETLSPER